MVAALVLTLSMEITRAAKEVRAGRWCQVSGRRALANAVAQPLPFTHRAQSMNEFYGSHPTGTGT